MIVRNVAVWSASSCRWPRPRPRKDDGTCPVRQTTGAQLPIAVHKRGRGVQDAGPGNDREDSRPARRFRIAHRHVGGRLLVTRHDELDVRAVQRIEQRIDLRAWHAEQRRHAVGASGLDDGRTARELSLFKTHE